MPPWCGTNDCSWLSPRTARHRPSQSSTYTKQVALEVRKLGQLDGGQVGLWVGNNSGGDFANLVITPTK